ncbi:uncharacterized protein LOC144749320 [Ciona intestinalis]
MGSLQLLVSLCVYREHKILEKLDISTLGKTPVQETYTTYTMESLRPVIMPRNEVRIRASWSKGDHGETTERKNLATEIAEKTEKYVRALEHAKWWHRDVKLPKQAVSSFATATNSPDRRMKDVQIPKIKVQPGATPSCNRIPISSTPETAPSFHETLIRRSEARSILNERCIELDRRFASSIRESYLPITE